MVETIQVLWTPAGAEIPDIGEKGLVDIHDGDTPNIRMPVRMLSVDTPEVTAQTPAGAERVDHKFVELAAWIREGKARVTQTFADYILPRLETGTAGTLQFTHGTQAADWFKAKVEQRLTRPDGSRRKLFVRTADSPFDENHRLLAYVAPSYTKRELETLSRRERPTFNLDLVESGWAAPFIIFPNIPGELDMPLFLEAAVEAMEGGKGQYGAPNILPAYEYRMCEKLHSITKRILEGEDLPVSERLAWRSRYAADMRTRLVYGPEGYMSVPQPYRLWIWPQDVRRAMAELNLTPSPALVSA